LSTTVCSCAAYRQGYQKGLTTSREAYLQADLSRMRAGIKKYTSDKDRPPQTLEELLDTDYLSYVSDDPVTEKPDWIIVRYDCKALANCKSGIKDVHSASTMKSSKGNPYTDW